MTTGIVAGPAAGQLFRVGPGSALSARGRRAAGPFGALPAPSALRRTAGPFGALPAPSARCRPVRPFGALPAPSARCRPLRPFDALPAPSAQVRLSFANQGSTIRARGRLALRGSPIHARRVAYEECGAAAGWIARPWIAYGNCRPHGQPHLVAARAGEGRNGATAGPTANRTSRPREPVRAATAPRPAPRPTAPRGRASR